MKSLTHYIQEKLVIKKNKDANYKYFPETKEELQAGVDRFIARFLNLKDKKENVSISKSSIDSPKVYTK